MELIFEILKETFWYYMFLKWPLNGRLFPHYDFKHNRIEAETIFFAGKIVT